MRFIDPKKRVVFCTFSNFKLGNQGDSVNDRKLFEAIPNNFEKIVIYPKYNNENRIILRSLFHYFILILKEAIKSNNIFITRAPKLAILPLLFKKIFNNKVIIRMGCTPFVFIERRAFYENLEFKPKSNFIKKFFYFLEPYIEILAVRHADKFIIENEKARRLAIFFGAKPNKIKLIPYYVQEYFLEGKNPEFNINQSFFKLAYTGRFSLYDLLTPVINAISILMREKYRVKLYLIGDGINRKNLELLVIKKGLTGIVEFLGSKSHQEVANLINSYHCLILPMLNKICPSAIAIKILEGVMRGKIIITTNSGNNTSLFSTNKDLILPNSSKEAIAEKIKLIINNYYKYRKISEELSNYHKQYRSKERTKKLLEDLLFEISS